MGQGEDADGLTFDDMDETKKPPTGDRGGFCDSRGRPTGQGPSCLVTSGSVAARSKSGTLFSGFF